MGKYRFLILDGHKSHYSNEFEQYYKNKNIFTFCIFIYLFYFFQPLDVGYFNLIKKIYDTKIEYLV